MRHHSIMLLVAIRFFLTSPAAEAQSSEFNFGFKGGLDAATQQADLRENRYGFSGGIHGNLQWPLFDQLSLGGQIELLYTPRGSEVVFQGVEAGQLRTHYIDLTVTARPELRFGRIGAYLLLGGGLNYLITASKDDAAGAGQDVTSGLHRIDVALLGAAGVALHLSSHDPESFHLGTIFLEARHDIGLLDVDLDGGFKNRTSSLLLGLTFATGGQPPISARTTRPSN